MRNGTNMRFLAIIVFASGTLVVKPAAAQDTKYVPEGTWTQQMILAPQCKTPIGDRMLDDRVRPCETHEAWLKDITHWREERKARIGYDGSRYQIPSLQWTQRSFIQSQMMVEDRYFYDSVSGKYTVDRYLDDLQSRYGGIDTVVIWPTSPNLGIDDRNQLDTINWMPGGIPGLKQMVADFHKRGVRVLFPMVFWDMGTRDPKQPLPGAISHLLAQIDADGIYGDTQDSTPFAFVQASEKDGHSFVFQPQGPPQDESVAWALMTSGRYAFQPEPAVDRSKWLEPRHMVNVSDRSSRNKMDGLQFAFFNGVGWESGENIFGTWNGLSARDAEAARRMSTIERMFAPFLTSSGWEPFYPTASEGVIASKWPLESATLWTIVNRNGYTIDGTQLQALALDGAHYFDLYRGVELTPRGDRDGSRTNWVDLSFPIEANGFSAVLQVDGQPDPAVLQFMLKMKGMTAKPLASYSNDSATLTQRIVDIKPTKLQSATPSTMVHIPGGDFRFVVQGIEIQGPREIDADVQYPWEDSSRRFHEHFMHMNSFDIDKYPVTNLEFKAFIDATHYHPTDDLNFLKDWQGGTYLPGWESKPVTWVSLEDARAYAAWAGKRLPHEWEWQYAAQHAVTVFEPIKYPWGNRWREEAVPLPDQGRTMRGPDNVFAHPMGSSALGVMDLVGNVWQWTDEYVDEHTRSAIVRGGSYYQPQGSKWYFPQGYQNDQHGKLLLMAPGMDRAGTIGFRCVTDSPPTEN